MTNCKPRILADAPAAGTSDMFLDPKPLARFRN
jgi:hypothetical protein